MTGENSKKYIIIGVFIVISIIVSCFYSSYTIFLKRGQNYYKKIASSCDYLILKTKENPSSWIKESNNGFIRWRIEKDDELVPMIIRKLKPERIEIVLDKANKYHVWIGVKIQTRNGYGISWEEINSKESLWALTAATEGNQKIVYSLKRVDQGEHTGF